MKKRYLFASLLMASLLMASCAKSEEPSSNLQNSQTSSEQSSTDNSISVESSEESTSSESSKDSSSEDSSSSDSTLEVDPKPNPDPDPDPIPTYKTALELYNASREVMIDTNYEMISKGTSTNSMSGSLSIYELFQHRTDAIYFEKASNGNAILGINTAYAERAYIPDNTTAKRESAETGTAWSQTDGVVSVDNWNGTHTTTPASVYEEFGKTGDNYVNFNIANDTITPSSNNFVMEGDNYILNFDLIINDGINSKSIAGYSNQVKTMSKTDMINASRFSIKITLGKDLRPISYTTHEEYQVKKAFVKPTVTNELTYTFKYYENKEDLPLKSF